MMGTLGLSLLLYKNVTIVRAVANVGCRLLQRCFLRTSDSLKVSTNHYSFHLQNKTRQTQCGDYTRRPLLAINDAYFC